MVIKQVALDKNQLYCISVYDTAGGIYSYHALKTYIPRRPPKQGGTLLLEEFDMRVS